MVFGNIDLPKYKEPSFNIYGPSPKKKKPRTATAHQKMLYWDIHPHICHICNQRISRISEAELDHVRAHAKGGATMLLAHRGCNRSKSDKSLSKARQDLGIKYKRKRRVSTKRRPIKASKPKTYFDEVNSRIADLSRLY